MERDYHQNRSRMERENFILSQMAVQLYQTGRKKPKFTFRIGWKTVCAIAWRATLGINRSTYYEYEKSAKKGM